MTRPPYVRVEWQGPSEPTDVQDGDLWLNTETGAEYLRVDGEWALIIWIER